MNELLWLLVYMIGGVMWGIYAHDDTDTPGQVFLYLFLWPLPLVSVTTFWLCSNIVVVVDVLFELMEPEDEE